MIDTSNDLGDRLFNAAEAARYLGFAEGTVRNKAAAGELPSVKLGPGNNALRFRRSELDKWISDRDAEAKAAKASEPAKVPA